jgi:hypothetical protein
MGLRGETQRHVVVVEFHIDAKGEPLVQAVHLKCPKFFVRSVGSCNGPENREDVRMDMTL